MEIRPRGFGDNLNDWFGSLRRNWKALLVIAAITHIPLGLTVVLVFWVTGAADSWALLTDPDVAEGLTNNEALELMIPFVWSLVAWTLVQAVVAVYVYLVTARIVAVDHVERDETWQESLRFAGTRLMVALGSSLLVLAVASALLGMVVALAWVVVAQFSMGFLTVFVIMVMALTALVVLTWLGVSVAFAPQVIGLEGLGPVSALARSFRLVQGRWWVTVGFLLVTVLIASAVAQVGSIVIFPVFLLGVVRPELLAIGYGLIGLIQGPLVAAVGVAYAVWYLDLRARDSPFPAEQLV